MEEMKDKISSDNRSRLEAEIKKVEEAISSNNTDQMKSATDSLSKVWNEIASQLYSQSGGPQAQGEQGGQQQAQGGTTEEGKENVQDASYEVVDEEEDKKKDK